MDTTRGIIQICATISIEKRKSGTVLTDDLIEVPIEVKYTNKAINTDELNGRYNFKRKTGVKNAILITEDILQSGKEYVQIPASLFLLLV